MNQLFPYAHLKMHSAQAILKTLHSPLVNDIMKQVRNAYADVLPGLPYPELPVVALSGK